MVRLDATQRRARPSTERRKTRGGGFVRCFRFVSFPFVPFSPPLACVPPNLLPGAVWQPLARSHRCPPCRQIAPFFDALSLEHPEVVFVKVDVDKVPGIGRILGVWAMPSFFFLKDGETVGSFTGAREGLLRQGIANGGRVGGVCSSCAVQ